MIPTLVFAKAPRPGLAKTRLSAEIGSDLALDIYREMGRRVIQSITPVSDITVFFDPPDAEWEIAQWLGSVSPLLLVPQAAGDLGGSAVARRVSAFRQGVWRTGRRDRRGRARGGPEIIRAAAGALQRSPVVLGPAVACGCVIGLREAHETPFGGMPWGTDRLLQDTVEACRGAGPVPAMLPALRDVDCSEDARVLGLIPLDR